MVERVADQVCIELRARATNNYDDFNPLRWSMHGGPGTGKSHVIKIIKTELFEKLLKYKMVEDFHIVALQAVMADLLGGDTIHHAFNLPVFGKTKATNSEDVRKQKEVAKQLLQCRWLIIDEISMVSARLLAEIDCKLRALARASSPFTKNKRGMQRSFGGLNVLFSGDVWQLPPPDGGFLGDIPVEYIRNARKYSPTPSIAHGQSLLWSDDVETGVQGVTELKECERTKDVWLRSVQDEFRYGRLTAETHALLHGKPTMQPGSFLDGTVQCGYNKCTLRSRHAKAQPRLCEEFAKVTVDRECVECKRERGRRQLVANVATDPRFRNDKFEHAPSVFANNDIKYEVNKLRAQAYAVKRQEGLVYCPAKDTPSTEALRLRQDLPSQK